MNAIASTSKLPPPPSPRGPFLTRPFSCTPPPLAPSSSSSSPRPARLRLSPTTRTRLTNLSFAAAVAVSVLTVSLAMSGATSSVTGVGLPCPARKDAARGVRSEEEPANKAGGWWGAGSRSRHGFLDDPVPSGGRVGVQAAGTGLKGRRLVEEGVVERERPRVKAGEATSEAEGWTTWARRRVGV